MLYGVSWGDVHIGGDGKLILRMLGVMKRLEYLNRCVGTCGLALEGL